VILSAWATRWGVSPEALADLQAQLVALTPTPPEQLGESEAAVQTRVRLEASSKGLLLWRNNVGVLFDERGVPVRFGLCNESKQMNERVKSSDLVGVRPLLIEPWHVGHTVGQFVAREVKHASWRWGEDPKREGAQLKFLELVAALGGDAAFTTGVGTL